MIIVIKQTAPPKPPRVRPVVEPRYGLGVMLIGGDGSTWDLYNGPVRLLAGSSGFGTPKPTHWYKESPAIDGAAWQGMRTGPKDTIQMPIYIHEPTSLGWRDTDAAFFDAVAPEGECTLVVATPDAVTRTLRMRFVDGGDAQFDVDPLLLRYGAYVLQFIAADPYFRSDPILTTFTTAAPQAMFPGPPFKINPATLLTEATVDNPGDVPAWPRWRVVGPFTGFSVGVGGSQVTYVGTKAAGQSVIVDMDPRRRSIVDDSGTDAWEQVTVANFEPIPRGEGVPLALDLTGPNTGTRIELEFTPGYRRAW